MEDDLLIVPSGSPESYCRLCFSESNVEPLIRDCHGLQPNQPLLDLIRRHVAIRLDPAKGTLPCGICGTCRMMLEEFQRFRERCLKCDYVLTGELREENADRDGEDCSEEEKICHQCRMAFSSISEMDEHFQVVHGLEQKYKCPACSLRFGNLKNFERHKKTHEADSGFRCHLCSGVFRSKSLLKRHREKWHEARVYECHHCTRVFATEVHMNLHTKSMHVPAEQMGPLPEILPAKKAKLDVTPPAVAPTVNVATQQSNENKPFECTTCFNRFHFVGSIKRHVREVHMRAALPQECKPLVPIHPAIVPQEPAPTITLPLEPTVFQLEPLPDPVEPEPVVVVVNEPVEETVVPNVEENHETIASKQEQYPRTTACFIRLERLDENIVPAIANYEIPVGKYYFHTRQKKALLIDQPAELPEDDELAQLYPGFLYDQSRRVFPCDICGKELVTPEGLKRHVVRHNTEYAYSCEECGRGFSDKGSRDRHRHLHTNDFPHKCDECPVGFVRPLLLAKHKKRYHGPNAAKLKVEFCPVCKRAFPNRNGVAFHLRHQHPEYRTDNETQQAEPSDAGQMDVDEETSLGVDDGMMLDDKTAVFNMLL